MAAAFVQGRITPSGGANTLAYSSALTVGNTLMATCRINGGTVTTLSDPTNGNWTEVTGARQTIGAFTHYWFYKLANAASTAVTVTVSHTGTNCRLNISEYSGVPNAPTLWNAGNGTGTTPNSGNITIAGTMLAVGAVMGSNGTMSVFTNASGWTLRGNDSSDKRLMSSDQLTPSAGTLAYNPTFTGSDAWTCNIVAFPLVGPVTVAVGTGTVRVQGQAVSVLISKTIAVGTRTVTVQGQPITLGKSLLVGTGVVRVLGNAIVVLGQLAPLVRVGSGLVSVIGNPITLAVQNIRLEVLLLVRRRWHGVDKWGVYRYAATRVFNRIVMFKRTLPFINVQAQTGTVRVVGNPVKVLKDLFPVQTGIVRVVGNQIFVSTPSSQRVVVGTATVTVQGQQIRAVDRAKEFYILQAMMRRRREISRWRSARTSGGSRVTVQVVRAIKGPTFIRVVEGVVTVQGNPITLALQKRIAVGSGAVIVTGDAVTLSIVKPNGVPVGTANIRVQGQQIGLGRFIAVATGAVNVVGNPVTIKLQNQILKVGTGSVVVQGDAVTVFFKRVVGVDTATLTVVGDQITLRTYGAWLKQQGDPADWVKQVADDDDLWTKVAANSGLWKR